MTLNPNYYSLFWSYGNFLYSTYQPQQTIKLHRTKKKFFQKYNLYHKNVNKQIVQRLESVQQLLVQNRILLHRSQTTRKKKKSQNNPKKQTFFLSKVWSSLFLTKTESDNFNKIIVEKNLKKSQKRRLKELESLENSRSEKTIGLLSFRLIQLIQQRSYTCEELTETTGFLKQRVSNVLRIYHLLNLVTLDPQTLKYEWDWKQSEMLPEINEKIKIYFQKAEKKRQLLDRLSQIQQKFVSRLSDNKQQDLVNKVNTKINGIVNSLSSSKICVSDQFRKYNNYSNCNENINNKKNTVNENFFALNQTIPNNKPIKVEKDNSSINNGNKMKIMPKGNRNRTKTRTRTRTRTQNRARNTIKQENVSQQIAIPFTQETNDTLALQNVPTLTNAKNENQNSFKFDAQDQKQESEQKKSPQNQNNLNDSEKIFQDLASDNSCLNSPEFSETEFYENSASSPYFFETTPLSPLEIDLPNFDNEELELEAENSLEFFSNEIDAFSFDTFSDEKDENNCTPNWDNSQTLHLLPSEFNVFLPDQIVRGDSNSNLSLF
ncbi:hypothetical protein M0813_13456 [Anaeramoeba flamelloides]|uniref:E2F/DP family winged-helix DNA-binding domain-containing protein n=1 Tax=Anaeramoeba flamelloides TaxID=1746091 RepID=A0ABQ8Z8G8_9EUKA|nr:hypothetical protein M0813_13456 [Anaeramoeba flamelloides]